MQVTVPFVDPAWLCSVSVVDEPTATTLLSEKSAVPRIDGHHRTRGDRRRAGRVRGVSGPPAFCTPSTFLITLIMPVFVVLLNVHVHVSPGFTVTARRPVDAVLRSARTRTAHRTRGVPGCSTSVSAAPTRGHDLAQS